jgi:ADP-ribose pyrophosphatase YjhB (NUDIX family)
VQEQDRSANCYGWTIDEWGEANRVDPKFCLRCGAGLRMTYVAEERCRRLVCAQCRFIHYQNPKVVAATLPVRNGKIYLLRRNIEPSLGRWTFPAGYMELGEDAMSAAARETREEICCRVADLRLHNVYSYPDSGVVTVVFRARVIGAEPRPGAESQCVQAFRPSEIPWRDLAFRSTFHALRDWVHLRAEYNKGR